MKAERRHELKTNALARRLEGLPDYWREYGSRILLAILVAMIVFLLVRYWNEKKARQAAELTTSLEQVQRELVQLDQLPMLYLSAPPNKIADERQRLAQEADQALATVLNTAKDPKMIANAWRFRGDLEWTLANLPDVPGADTQPTLKVTNKDALLNDSRNAYQQVLSQSADDPLDVFSARLGLAAIAENQGQWDEARKQYQTILDAGNMPAAFKDYASTRLRQLTEDQRPITLAPAAPLPTAATRPATASTQPTILGPEAPAATSQPGTLPPTTGPAAGPLETPAPVTSQPATQQNR